MPRHDPSADTGAIRAADDYTVASSAVSYLSQFPEAVPAVEGDARVTQFVIEPEPPRLPVAHMFSS